MAELATRLCREDGCEEPTKRGNFCADHLRERSAAAMRRWRARNPGESARRLREARQQNVEQTRSRGLAYYYRNRERLNAQRRLRLYGVSLAEYERLFAAQDGACGICNVTFDEEHKFAREIHVDHCHKTGKVRGLLCGSCNRGIGVLNDDVDRLRAAIRWLEERN